jgi:hypothetical protein
MYRTVRGASAAGSGEAAPSRVVVRDARWYQHQADRLAALGHYADAMQAAFISWCSVDARDLTALPPQQDAPEYCREQPGFRPTKVPLWGTSVALYACVSRRPLWR